MGNRSTVGAFSFCAVSVDMNSLIVFSDVDERVKPHLV